MDVKIEAIQVNCVVPGNIHTPTTDTLPHCSGLDQLWQSISQTPFSKILSLPQQGW